MRLSLSINGTSRVTAAMSGPGYLSAHLNVHDRPKEDDYSKTIHISGYQTLETETVVLEWRKFDLQNGDAVELRVLDDGEGDAPSSSRTSSESPGNLFSRSELARELLSLVSDFEGRLMQLVAKSEKCESPDEQKRLTAAVGRVLMELGNSFLYPVYRRHKELVPDELRG